MMRPFYARFIAKARVDDSKAPRQDVKPLLSSMLILRVAVSVGILVALLCWLPTEKLLGALRSIPWTTWSVVLTGFIGGHVLSSLKWRMILHATGTDIRVSRAIRAHAAGLCANLCLPSIVGGDFVRAAMVVREERGQMEKIALGSLADRLNDTTALVGIAAVASLMLPIAGDIPMAQLLTPLAFALLLGIVGGITVIRLIARVQLPHALRNIVGKTNEALDLLFTTPGTALAALLLSVSIQGCFVGLNLLLARAIGIESPAVVWLFAWPMAKLVALTPVSLGGIGVREVALAGLLGPFGIEPSIAVAQSLSWEVVLILSGILSGTWVALTASRPTSNDTDYGREDACPK